MITNPLQLLKSDHEKVKKLFGDYNNAEGDEKSELKDKISEELTIHMEMEEKYFYPKIEDISEEAKNLIMTARGQHDEAKEHIGEMAMESDEMDLDPHMKELRKGVLEHVEMEENKIFPLAENNINDQFPKMLVEMLAFKTKEKITG